MPHVSKKRLKEEDEKLIKDRFINILQTIGKDRNSKYSLMELLSETETIMLAKRLTIIYLLDKETSILEICSMLNVSSSTVLRIGKTFDREGYKNLQSVINKPKSSFIDILEILARGGLPPKFGKGRWKFLNNY